MSLLWNDNLKVGHPIIDAQHRELFDAFAAFVDACQAKRGLDHLKELLAFLERYVHIHFAAEEALMTQHGYADIDAHLRQHRHFIERIDALRQELAARGATVSVLVKTTKTLVYWLTEHIRDVDGRLVTFLAGHPDS